MRPYVLGALIGVLAAAAVGFGLLYVLESDDDGAAEVAVPSLLGATEESATAGAESAGLSVEIVQGPGAQYSGAVLGDEPVVLEQFPNAGADVPPGTVVTLTLGREE